MKEELGEKAFRSVGKTQENLENTWDC